MLGNRPSEDDDIYPTLVQLGTVFGSTAAVAAAASVSSSSDLTRAVISSSNSFETTKAAGTSLIYRIFSKLSPGLYKILHLLPRAYNREGLILERGLLF